MAAITGLIRIIDHATVLFGKAFAWAGLGMIVFTVANVILRYVFGISLVAFTELVVYSFAMVLTACVGWALLRDDHVRVDVFYHSARPKVKAAINLAGLALMVAPLVYLIATRGYPYVARSWALREGSMDQSGLHITWIMKSFILVFAAALAVAAVSFALKCVLVLAGRPVPAAPDNPTE
jgi:TRAP-type mannitol/chloroaromatic compound transport system permease small subunit